MGINILGFAVLLFIGLMLLEYTIAKKKKLPYFNLQNSIANVSVGIAERLCDVFVAGIFYFVYDDLQKNYGLFDIKPGVLLWILLFLLTDLVWYWYHRLAHEINLLWMAHIVHHQSEDFNYTASARITVFQAFVRTGFWAVLPLIGFPAGMITSLLLIHGIYPFFIHTRLVGKLGILEYILVTPSHHRVHHASDEKYLDKNYGDVLIIWDKLFGTFQKEEEEPKYGLTKPLKTYSFLWQHFHFAIELWLAVRSRKGFWNKLKVIFGKPADLDPTLREQAESIFQVHQHKGPIEKPLNRYVIWQIVILLLGLFFFILFEHYFTIPVKTGLALIIILTLINCGAIMEQKRWIFLVEFLRFTVILLLPFYSTAYWQSKLFITLLLGAVLLFYYRPIKENYLQYVYRRWS
jgi:sterol desaturase/sphingolipid hydroxylase (fatty acid hydroxylase superfamily)